MYAHRSCTILIFFLFHIKHTNQIGRQLGFFANGNIARRNYRIAYASFAYLLRRRIFSRQGRLQPFYAYTYKNFEGMGTNTTQHDFGLNYLLHGHQIKFSLQYSSRPIYQGTIGTDAQGEVVDTKRMVIFQTQTIL